MSKPLRVVISAAAAGIGRAIAEAFARQGARVQICDVDETAIKEFRLSNRQIAAARVDVSRQSELDAWLDNALADLGGVDVLVNNAGSKGPTAYMRRSIHSTGASASRCASTPISCVPDAWCPS